MGEHLERLSIPLAVRLINQGQRQQTARRSKNGSSADLSAAGPA
jgi:hypothetical protein